MPFRDYSGFDANMLRNMTAAYDAALAKLNINSSDPVSSNLAAAIAALASEGERDPKKLCEGALTALKDGPKKKWTRRSGRSPPSNSD